MQLTMEREELIALAEQGKLDELILACTYPTEVERELNESGKKEEAVKEEAVAPVIVEDEVVTPEPIEETPIVEPPKEKPKKARKAKKVDKSTTDAEAPKEEPKVETPKTEAHNYTLDEVTKEAIAVINASAEAPAKLTELLGTLGVQSLPELDTSQFGKFMEGLEKIKGEINA